MVEERKGTKQICPCLSGDLRKLAVRMREVDWRFEQGRHCKAYAPDGITMATLACTPSDVRGFRNARAAFRRWCKASGIEPGI